MPDEVTHSVEVLRGPGGILGRCGAAPERQVLGAKVSKSVVGDAIGR